MEFIAELAKAHGGNVETAKEMITAAKKGGFDAVKIQAYRTEDIIEAHGNSERYKRCHLDMESIRALKSFADREKIKFFCSVFSEELIGPLSRFISRVKIPSTFFPHISFVSKCLRSFDSTHVSTGMASVETIGKLMKIYESHLHPQPVFYACTSLYPTPIKCLRLSRINKFKMKGLSLHSRDFSAVLYAILSGVRHVEIHFNPKANNAWTWNTTDFIALKKFLEAEQDYFTESDITPVEVANQKFFRGEFLALQELK